MRNILVSISEQRQRKLAIVTALMLGKQNWVCVESELFYFLKHKNIFVFENIEITCECPISPYSFLI